MGGERMAAVRASSAGHQLHEGVHYRARQLSDDGEHEPADGYCDCVEAKDDKQQQQNELEPPQKRQRVNDTSQSQPQNVVSDAGTATRTGTGTGMGSEPIKCQTCNKIFTLEVDLLLHKTN